MFLSTAVFFSTAALSQSRPNPVTFGISAGAHLNTINGKNATGGSLNHDMKLGFNGGVNAEFPMRNGFYLQPGVEFRQEGAELENGSKLSLSYVNIPVNLMYKAPLTTGRVLVGFGPYVGFGIDGKMEAPDGTERDVVFNNTYSVADAGDLQFRKMDAGANFIAGYEFRNKISAAIKAQLGLIDINTDTKLSDDKTSYRNTGFGLSLGYRF